MGRIRQARHGPGGQAGSANADWGSGVLPRGQTDAGELRADAADMSKTTSIEFKLTPRAQAILDGLKTMPAWMMDAICLGMDRANAVALANIQRNHLTGKGPFPPEEHRLGRVSGNLATQAWASSATASGSTVTSS